MLSDRDIEMASPTGTAPSIEDYLPEGTQPIPERLPPGVTVQTSNQGGSLTVRSVTGLHLEIHFRPTGAELFVKGVVVRIDAREELLLASRNVSIEARETISFVADAIDTRANVRSSLVRGTDRLEASVIEVQASSGPMSFKAEAGISLDGESIGLNNESSPAPFEWSERAKELRQ